MSFLLVAAGAAQADPAATGSPDTATARAATDASAPDEKPALSDGPYIGVGGGHTRFNYSDNDCTAETGYPCTTTPTSPASKVFLGYRHNSGGFEIGYVDFGTLKAAIAAPLTGVELDEKVTATQIAFVGNGNIVGNLGLSPRIGYYWATVSASGNGNGLVSTRRANTRNVSLGADLTFSITPKVMLRLGLERFFQAGEDSTNIDLAAASLVLGF